MGRPDTLPSSRDCTGSDMPMWCVTCDSATGRSSSDSLLLCRCRSRCCAHTCCPKPGAGVSGQARWVLRPTRARPPYHPFVVNLSVAPVPGKDRRTRDAHGHRHLLQYTVTISRTQLSTGLHIFWIPAGMISRFGEEFGPHTPDMPCCDCWQVLPCVASRSSTASVG